MRPGLSPITFLSTSYDSPEIILRDVGFLLGVPFLAVGKNVRVARVPYCWPKDRRPTAGPFARRRNGLRSTRFDPGGCSDSRTGRGAAQPVDPASGENSARQTNQPDRRKTPNGNQLRNAQGETNPVFLDPRASWRNFEGGDSAQATRALRAPGRPPTEDPVTDWRG